MKDPWTWTMVWGLTMEVEGRLGGEGQRGKKWDIFNSINNKTSKTGGKKDTSISDMI